MFTIFWSIAFIVNVISIIFFLKCSSFIYRLGNIIWTSYNWFFKNLFFKSVSVYFPVLTTTTQAPLGMDEYQIATYSVGALAVVLIIICVALGIVIWRMRPRDYWRHDTGADRRSVPEEIPLRGILRKPRMWDTFSSPGHEDGLQSCRAIFKRLILLNHVAKVDLTAQE